MFESAPETVTVITLLVNPQGAEKLALADGYGHILLALRNPLDRASEGIAPLVNASLFGGHAETAPIRAHSGARAPAAPVAAPSWVVEVISGDKQEKASFARRSPLREAGLHE